MTAVTFRPLARAACSAVCLIFASNLPAPAFAQEEPAEEAAPAEAQESAPAEATEATETTGGTADAAATEPNGTAEAVAEPPVATIPVEQAKEEAPAEGTQLDAIEVTGSRLRRTDYETSQPVVVLSREDIERTGLTDISDILRNITAAGNNSLSAAQGRFAFTMGETNLDLRNLGANHTLLLVNGRRWVTGLIQTQTSVSDFNTIPTAIIERIEILKDGASAIYGSDAIGGVVNVITRKDYDGTGVSYQFGQFFEQGDGNNQQATISLGRNFGKTNVFVNLNYTDQGEAPNENREVTARPNVGPTRDSIVPLTGLIRMVNPTSANATEYQCPNLQAGIAAPIAGDVDPMLGTVVTQTGAAPAGLVLCDLTLDPDGTGGTGAREDYHQIQRTNPLDVYNRFGDGTLKEPNTRSAAYTQISHQLTDRIALGFESLYNYRDSRSVGQNAYLGGGNYDGGQKGYLAYIPSSNINNPFGQDIGFDSTCASDPEAPTCTNLGTGSGSWAIRRAGEGINNQTFGDTVETLRLGGSAQANFDLLGMDLYLDGGYVYGRSKIEETLQSVNYEKAGKALGVPGTTCDAAVDGCAPLNVLQGQAGLAQSAAAIDYILDTAWQRNRSQQDIAYVNASTLFPLPGDFLPGPIAVAVGGEYRKDAYSSDIDPIIRQGLIRLNTFNPLVGETSAKEAYIELGIPLAKGQRLAEGLDLDLAGRYSSYPRIGGVETGKAGLRWQVVDELLVRTTYSTGFRAPSVGELYLGAAQSFDPLADPCADPGTNDTADQNCLSDGAAGGGGGGVATPYDIWQGNLDLKPEASKNWTYGLIFSPSFVPDLNLSLDFYQIDIEDYVVIGQGQFFLDSCYKTPRETGAAPNSGPYCQYINRDGSGALTSVNTPYFNLARVETSGLDLGLDYMLPLSETLGRYKLSMEASYLTEFDYASPVVGAGEEVSSAVGQAGGQFSGYPRWKAGGYLQWSLDRFKASWSTRMAYHYVEPCGDLFPTPSLKDLGVCSDPDKVDAEGNEAPENRQHTVFYHNVQLGYDLAEYNAGITFGVNNVLDQDPPVSRSLSSLYWYNYDPNHYETPGRFGYLKVDYKF